MKQTVIDSRRTTNPTQALPTLEQIKAQPHNRLTTRPSLKGGVMPSNDQPDIDGALSEIALKYGDPRSFENYEGPQNAEELLEALYNSPAALAKMGLVSTLTGWGGEKNNFMDEKTKSTTDNSVFNDGLEALSIQELRERVKKEEEESERRALINYLRCGRKSDPLKEKRDYIEALRPYKC